MFSNDLTDKSAAAASPASRGLSSDCKLHPMVLMAIWVRGDEHPCDRCNMDRKECRGYPRIDEA